MGLGADTASSALALWLGGPLSSWAGLTEDV
jgi:hypothetical protein